MRFGNFQESSVINMPAAGKNAKLRVVFISHSDLLGGAGVVSYRLMYALRKEGIDARMISYTRISDDENIVEATNRSVRAYRFLLERISIFLTNRFDKKNLFKVSYANTGLPVWEHPWVKNADVILLNWINQGLLSLKGIEKLSALGKPIIWTMHDMWCLTGICHHSLGCDRYKRECGKCMFLHSHKLNDMSHKVWKRKKHLYENSDICFVAVSHWLQEKCKESSLLGEKDVKVIFNAVPVDEFLIEPTHEVQSFYIDYSRDVILMGAARLDDSIKGLTYAIDALNYLFDNHPDISNQCTAVFFGDLRDVSLLDKLRFPHTYLGRVNDKKMLRQLYARAKVVISSSLYETLPGTLIEGQASGCIPVSFAMGGQSDIITHKVNGYIAEYMNPVSLAKGIIWALNSNIDRATLHEEVRQKFSSESIAKEYIRLFEDLLSKKRGGSSQSEDMD